MSKKKNIFLMLVAFFLTSTQPLLADDLEYRQGLMNVYVWNIKPMGSMVKGKIPFDAGKFQRHATDLATATTLDLLAGYPVGSNQGETDALNEIWLDWDNFAAINEKMKEKAAELKRISASGDLEMIRPAYKALADTCRQCHKKYKD
jgi:cytochrome c556